MRFLRKKREYVARREETKDKTIMDIKKSLCGQRKRRLGGIFRRNSRMGKCEKNRGL